MAQPQKTQLEKANEALVRLVTNITTADRKEAKNNWSEFTIIQYLQGRGKNLDTAMNMLTFFRNRINTRSEAIA